MDFGFTTDDERMAGSVRDILTRDPVTDHLKKLTRAGAPLDRPLWKRLAEVGLLGATVDTGHSGSGLGLTEIALAVRACGELLAVVPVAETLTAAALLSKHADPGFGDATLPGVADGTTVATVQAPFDDGLNARLGAVTAAKDGNGWTLTGDARAVPFAADAQLALLPATVDGHPRMFAVRSDDPGVTVHTGQYQADVTWPLGSWRMDKVPVPSERLLGEGAAGHAGRVLRVADALLAVGGAARVMDVTTSYVSTRVQFGQVIAAFQAVRHHAATMRVRLDTAEPAAYFAAWSLDYADADADADADDAGWVGFLGAASSYLELAKLGIQLHGAIGFTWEHPLHLHLRRAQRIASTFGSVRAGYRRLGLKARTRGVAALAPT